MTGRNSTNIRLIEMSAMICASFSILVIIIVLRRTSVSYQQGNKQVIAVTDNCSTTTCKNAQFHDVIKMYADRNKIRRYVNEVLHDAAQSRILLAKISDSSWQPSLASNSVK